MARKKNQSARREQLTEAAQRAIAQHGAAGVRVEHVALEAGVSPNTVRYYYKDVEELLRDAHRKAIERFYTNRMIQAREIEDPVERLVATIDAGVASGPDDPETRLLWEGTRRAGESELFSVVMTNLYKQQELLYENILELGVAVGAFELNEDLCTIAQTLVALEDICGIRMMHNDPTFDHAEGKRMVLAYARLATGYDLPE
ncbi:MAG: TetR/AcrR family transcriptional regulator [candidate division NC10 bacterium]